MASESANGIAAFGVAYPRFRLESGAVGVPAFDEDEVTLAVAAARRLPTEPCDELLVASRTEGAARIVAEALGIEHAHAVDLAGGADAGLSALRSALESRGKRVLVVGAGVGERGAGGAAFLVTQEGVAQLVPMSGAAPDFLATGSHGLAVRHDGKPLVAAAKRDAVERASPRATIGDAGAASALLELAACLVDAKAGAQGDVAADAGGRVSALRLSIEGHVEGALPTRAPQPIDATRAAAHRRTHAASLGIPDVPMGAYVSAQEYARDLGARYRLVGKRCRACGRIHFPPRGSCVACARREFEDVPLSGKGTVYAATTIGKGAGPSEFALEQVLVGEYVVAVVELAEGPRLAARLADVEKAPPIGTAVEGVFRRVYAQQGTVRYGTKFRPA